jgi:hypothetical protein
MAKIVPCVGCGALVSATPGPIHRYMISAPACWGMYGALNAVLSASAAEEYRQWWVDAYAVQTPANRTRRRFNPWPATF